MYKIVGADGKIYGPASAEQLRQWLAEGRANAQTQTLAEGAPEWKPLGTLPEFAGQFAPPTPPVILLVAAGNFGDVAVAQNQFLCDGGIGFRDFVVGVLLWISVQRSWLGLFTGGAVANQPASRTSRGSRTCHRRIDPVGRESHSVVWTGAAQPGTQPAAHHVAFQKVLNRNHARRITASAAEARRAAVARLFRRDRARGDRAGFGRGFVFLQSGHARILSGVPVSQADRSELSGLRRNTGGVSIAARTPFECPSRQRAVHSGARGPDPAGRVVCRAQNLPSTRHAGRAAKSLVDVPGRCHRFQRVAEFAGVFVSLALNPLGPSFHDAMRHITGT